MCTRVVLLLALVCLVSSARPASAQAEPPVGVRAAGMGGAFVGVADDASAVYWNPAGLASGSFFSLAVDRNSVMRPTESPAPHGGSAFLLALGTPPLGFSFYRTSTAVRTATAEAGDGRNTDRTEHLTTQDVGVTLVQSVHHGVAVGGTFKLVHGETDLESRSTFDADLGVMAAGALGRVGLSVRNLLEPEFHGATGTATLQRRIRGGASILVRQQVTVAFDGDFTTADTARGEWRDMAVGAETHLVPLVWARGGMHWNTAGGSLGAAPVGSIGGSVAVYGALMADAQVTVGSKNGDRGWGVGLRFVY